MMNEIQQNAYDLCVGLRQMKWDRLEQEMLCAPVPAGKQHTPPAHLHRMRPSDAQLDRLFINEAAPFSEAAFGKQLPPSLNSEAVHVIAGPTHSAELLYADIPAHLPQQIRNQMKQSIGAFYNV